MPTRRILRKQVADLCFYLTPYDIKPQLISYVGGQAGTEQSTVVDPIPCFARECGQSGSVKTLAFTGAVAITYMAIRCTRLAISQLNGAESNAPPSNELLICFSEVVLVIIDIISTTDQALLDGCNSVSRAMSMPPGKFMGGKHVIRIGDYFQLPPVAWYPCKLTIKTQVFFSKQTKDKHIYIMQTFNPPCSASRLRHAGDQLYSAINLYS
ncbi:hypothetical protein PHMEG_0001242 [Phytophthora megakarya]|uniref:ATP-dependent DNA helicase n=1 Tax=Phytophthora megakarya TaxID=4795 RepID=A0A225X2D5_9STRA|nr:hypothetical protein PHMEG_0001242 [Phytophthora megakarya]